MKKIVKIRKGNGIIEEKQVSYIPMRYIIALMLAAIETILIIGIVVVLSIYIPYFYIGVLVTQIGVVIHIIASDNNPDYKIPWLLFVLIIPIIGFMLYFLFAKRKLNKKYIKRLDNLKKYTYQYDNNNFELLRNDNIYAHNQAKMLCNIADTKLFLNTSTKYYKSGEDMFKDMLEDLKSAREFIFLEYFIIEEGIFWNSILDILKERVLAGVDVRVVFDDIGCMMTLPGDYSKRLNRLGIKATPFSRVKGNADSEFNNRSHRKILVIDGEIGYTGGVNIADEYINEIVKFGHWKDGGIRLIGSAVNHLTKLFVEDYGINVKELDIEKDSVFKSYINDNDGYVIPFGDGPKPMYEYRVGKSVILNMINNATKYVYITTPYLIIDNELCSGIENAALRGVNVKIIVPHIPDKKMVFAMTRSFYTRLMKCGVEIYEYEKGFIHLKSYLVDDDYAMIGTINLDYRSLVHHFENGVWLYKSSCIRDLKLDINSILEESIKIDSNMLKHNIFYRFFCAIIKIFSPLL